ncbi:MAG: SgcJ/EcaC family oxidoreductase [Planctomycetes bacterium]|nr:SgcJ/EcaC family oxidoreductase [Planctomycetota bacterium]MBM4100448.1 SgcJ/EcaC family oxidoreductase [Planctomycetota bacterium]
MSTITQQVAEQLDRWFAALKSCNPKRVTDLYADDAILLSTLKGDVKKGHGKIHAYFKGAFLPKHPIGKVVEGHTRVIGGTAVNSGLYSFKIDGTDGKRVTVQARYTFVYQWTGQDWKIVEHHSSLNPEG